VSITSCTRFFIAWPFHTHFHSANFDAKISLPWRWVHRVLGDCSGLSRYVYFVL
jgi:hypothetical protein